VLALILVVVDTPMAHTQSTEWTGIASSVWKDTLNWVNGVPDSTTSTLVSYGSPGRFDLVVPAPAHGDTVRVGDLMIQHSGRILFEPAPFPGILVVHGNVLSLNGGELLLGDGKIIFKNDVQLNRGGNLDAGGGTLEFQGDVIAQSGSLFLPGTSTVVFSGDSDQTVAGDFEFNNVVVATGGTLVLNGTITVNGSVNVEAGATLQVDSGTVFTYDGEITGEGEFIDENPPQTTSVLSTSDGITPNRTGLAGNYPNPFNPETKVEYMLKEGGRVRISVFDVLGREIAVLVDDDMPSGVFRTTWNASGMPSGIYVYRMTSVELSGQRNEITRKMVLTR